MVASEAGGAGFLLQVGTSSTWPRPLVSTGLLLKDLQGAFKLDFMFNYMILSGKQRRSLHLYRLVRIYFMPPLNAFFFQVDKCNLNCDVIFLFIFFIDIIIYLYIMKSIKNINRKITSLHSKYGEISNTPGFNP